MIKLFGRSGADHPMADPKEARRVLDALPAQDHCKALEELAEWHESVSQSEGFRPEQRIERLLWIDDTAQGRVSRLTRDYLAQARPPRFQENRMWLAAHGYWREAGLAFARAVDLFVQGARGAESARAALPQLLVRCLRALAQQIKWMHLRYGPYDTAVWATFNKVYAYAEARKLAQTASAANPGTPGASTPQLEFLRGALFAASSPEGLLPAEVDLAERLVAALAGRFALAATSSTDLPYWTDLGQGMAPQRAQQPPPAAPGLRWLGAGAALAEAKALAERIRATDAVPAGLNLGAGDLPEDALVVLEHLVMYWAPHPPERKFQRHSVQSRLSVTNGLQGVIDTLGDSAGAGAERWLIENVSAGGFGALVPQVKGDWLRVGALVAMQPDGGSNWIVGLVRRVNKTAPLQARVGIQTLSRAPAVSQFALSGARSAAEQGVLLKGNDPASSEVRIALRPGVFAPGQNLEATHGGRQHVYLPTGFGARGEDYEIGRFRELVRDG